MSDALPVYIYGRYRQSSNPKSPFIRSRSRVLGLNRDVELKVHDALAVAADEYRRLGENESRAVLGTVGHRKRVVIWGLRLAHGALCGMRLDFLPCS